MGVFGIIFFTVIGLLLLAVWRCITSPHEYE